MNVGTETAAALKAQTEQMSRIVNELDSIHFSLKKASKLVKELGRQIATDKCIMALLFIIVLGVIAIIIVKVPTILHSSILSFFLYLAEQFWFYTPQLVNPNNKDIQDIPGLAPPAQSRKLLWNSG